MGSGTWTEGTKTNITTSFVQVGAMSFDVPDARAEEAMKVVGQEFVDLNELRVATELEVQDLLGLCLPPLGVEVGFACVKPGKFAAARQASSWYWRANEVLSLRRRRRSRTIRIARA